MDTVRSILLATDFRAASKEALRAAAQLARVFGARVSVLHVVHSTADSPSMLVHRKQLSETSMTACLEELAGLQVEVAKSLIAFGSAPLRIVRTADEWGADMIVMGAGERREHGHYIAGPVVETVMQHARQPVLAVRPGGPAVEFRKLLCPVDFSAVSRRGLRNAIRLAKCFQGELVVLSVVPELSWLGAAVETGVLAGAQDQHVTHWEDEFTRFLDESDFSGVKWRRDLRMGPPDRGIVLSAREHLADLIVMGATGRTGLARLMLGSVTQRVLQNLPCSVLTVHEEDLFLQGPDEEDVRVGRLLYAEAKGLLEAGDRNVALTKLTQALAHNPFNLPALTALAELCEKHGQHERASRCRRRIELLRQDILV